MRQTTTSPSQSSSEYFRTLHAECSCAFFLIELAVVNKSRSAVSMQVFKRLKGRQVLLEWSPVKTSCARCLVWQHNDLDGLLYTALVSRLPHDTVRIVELIWNLVCLLPLWSATVAANCRRFPPPTRLPPMTTCRLDHIMESWNHRCSFRVNKRIMESWSYGTMESWNHGIMELWNHGIMESWNHGITESWNHGIMESWMKSWNRGIMESRNHGIMESRNHGIVESWILIQSLFH